MFTNQYTMTDRLADLYQEVIDAARDGRYCHGNGAIWCIVEKTWDGQFQNVIINTAEINPFDGKPGFKQYCETANPVLPHKAEMTANNLERFLDVQTGPTNSYSYNDKEFGFQRILSELLRQAIKAGKEGRCIHWNGGQLYFKQENGSVRAVDFSIRGIVHVTDYGKLETRNYLKSGYYTPCVNHANGFWAERAKEWSSKEGMLVNA
jgi:hypothetical protein